MADKPKSLPIVQVDWMDADTATDGWERRSEIVEHQIKTVHSWGVLVSDTKDRLIVVGDYDPSSDNVNGGSIIPKVMIKKIKRLGTWRAS